MGSCYGYHALLLSDALVCMKSTLKSAILRVLLVYAYPLIIPSSGGVAGEFEESGEGYVWNGF